MSRTGNSHVLQGSYSERKNFEISIFDLENFWLKIRKLPKFSLNIEINFNNFLINMFSHDQIANKSYKN